MSSVICSHCGKSASNAGATRPLETIILIGVFVVAMGVSIYNFRALQAQQKEHQDLLRRQEASELAQRDLLRRMR